MSLPDNPVRFVIDQVRARVAKGETIEFAARGVWAHHREVCRDVMETIGSWPSSEPELLAIQRAS